MKHAVLLLLLFSLAGCVTPQFKVSPVDRSFSQNKNPMWTSEGNRISVRTEYGGQHAYDDGIYFNPWVELGGTGGEIVALGLFVMNKTEHTSVHGAAGALGRIETVAFKFADGDVLVFDVKDQENRTSDVQYSSAMRYAYYEILESGMIYLSPDQLRQIAFKDGLACKITGSRNAITYEAKDIAPTFQGNLQSFSSEYLKQ